MSSLIRCCAVVCFLSFALLAIAQESSEGRLLRFPDISKDKIAFVYGGDIWLVPSSGGTAHRITTYPGRELFPKFSPDGKLLAFTGQYDGNFNVYVMPADGGQPKQLTFNQGGAPLSDRMGIHNEVVTWTPDSKRIVFLTRRDSFNGWTRRPYSVSVNGGLPEAFPMDQGGLLSYSPDGTKIAYNTIFRNFRTWKRYTGGMAQDILLYDLKNNTVDRVPHTEYTDTFPMWSGSTVYFTSDRGPEHRLNLYSYDLGSKQIEQLTKFADFDVMWPSLGNGGIVFENGGYLHLYDIASKQEKQLAVQIPGERDQAMYREFHSGCGNRSLAGGSIVGGSHGDGLAQFNHDLLVFRFFGITQAEAPRANATISQTCQYRSNYLWDATRDSYRCSKDLVK